MQFKMIVSILVISFPVLAMQRPVIKQILATNPCFTGDTDGSRRLNRLVKEAMKYPIPIYGSGASGCTNVGRYVELAMENSAMENRNSERSWRRAEGFYVYGLRAVCKLNGGQVERQSGAYSYVSFPGRPVDVDPQELLIASNTAVLFGYVGRLRIKYYQDPPSSWECIIS